jgi:hypothetical protein
VARQELLDSLLEGLRTRHVGRIAGRLLALDGLLHATSLFDLRHGLLPLFLVDREHGVDVEEPVARVVDRADR